MGEANFSYFTCLKVIFRIIYRGSYRIKQDLGLIARKERITRLKTQEFAAAENLHHFNI